MYNKQYVYIGKDNRARIYLVDDEGNKKFMSYPRYLMEQKLGRKLLPEEDVHHKDGNTLNNELDNLEILMHGEHQRMHSTKYFDTIETCMVCGRRFIMTGHKWAKLMVDLRRGRNRYLTCSKQCAGRVPTSRLIYSFDENSDIEYIREFYSQ